MSSGDSNVCALPGTPLAAAAHGLDNCVHCGFCLQACPTYLAMDDENDSPRGRLVLMRALLEGDVSPDDPDVGQHIDRCLGCRACETACPSGVPYGHLLEATRATLATTRPLPVMARLILAVFQQPAALRMSLFLARILRDTRLSRLLARLPGSAGFPFAMIEATRPVFDTADYQPQMNEGGMPVILLKGCVMSGLFAHTNRATQRVLAVNGCRVHESAGDACCGALHVHAGDVQSARSLARHNIIAFETAPDALIVVNASGCGAMLKEYGDLFATDPEWHERAQRIAVRVRDVSEVLMKHDGGPMSGRPLPLRVAYDAPCHLVHAQRVIAPPLAVLDAVPGLQRMPLADADMCCGSAGIYNLVEPGLSHRVLKPKLDNIAASGAQLVATGNPGCIMQIGAGLLRSGSSVRVVHPVDVLDASYGASASNAPTNPTAP